MTETVSDYELRDGKNAYHWCLEQAGATVHAFQSFGSYQGDWFAKVTYEGKTGWIHDYYGSCSGCDSFEAETGYSNRTPEDWKQFASDFGKKYLNDLLTYDDVLAKARENESWDMEAADMIKFIEEAEQ